MANDSLVPSEDEHQSEEIGESDERRSWISGYVLKSDSARLTLASLDRPVQL